MVYEDLDVYKRAFTAALQIHAIADKFPKSEWYGGMADQIKRSSKSICANIAEGMSKRMSAPDKKRFISISMGSAEETRVWLAFAERLGYADEKASQELRSEYQQIARMLFKFQSSLKF